MNQINIGSIKIPINAATKTFAILAKRGAGKSYTAAVLAEEYSKNNIPFVVFDPIDVWWGLRLDKTGKGKGLPVVVFGLEHADIPLTRDMGKEIARAVVKENISCVISTFGMPKVAMRHLIAEFAEELLNINNTPRHVFIEEAHEFVPQRVQGAGAKCFSAVEALVVMGRNRGIGVTLINQRAATINKDVLTQLDTLIALRSVGPQDRKSLQDWTESHSAEGDFNKFISSLPSLPTGQAWIWSPEFMGIFERITIRKRETFHPDREKLGDKFEMPTLDSVDIEAFISKFTKQIEAPKEEVKEGKQKKAPVEKLHDFVEEKKTEAIIAMKNEYESRLLKKDTEIRDLKRDVYHLAEVVRKVRGVIGAGSSDEPTTITQATGQNSTVALWSDKFGSGLGGKAFKFLAENPGRKFSREQICLAIGVPSKAGHTSNEFQKIVRTGAVVKDGNMYGLNDNM